MFSDNETAFFKTSIFELTDLILLRVFELSTLLEYKSKVSSKITKYYPDSTGNIISGSYCEIYSRARSAAVSSFHFTGDYKIYRYKGM